MKNSEIIEKLKILGIYSSKQLIEKDIDYLLQNNFKTFLIGEFLMRNKSPEILLYNLLNKVNQ